MDIAEQLRAIGLTDGEARVYLALLRLGATTSGPVVEESRISSSKIYDILDRLEKKGLATHTVRNNRKVYGVTDPSALGRYVALRDQEMHAVMVGLTALLPQLQSIRELAGPLQEVQVGEGAQAIKVAVSQGLEEMKRGDTYYVMGVPEEIARHLPFFEDWHRQRIRKGIQAKMLYNASARQLAKKREKLKLTQARYLPDRFMSPTTITIIPSLNTTRIMLFGDRPFHITIKNKTLTNSFVSYFELIWETATY